VVVVVGVLPRGGRRQGRACDRRASPSSFSFQCGSAHIMSKPSGWGKKEKREEEE